MFCGVYFLGMFAFMMLFAAQAFGEWCLVWILWVSFVCFDFGKRRVLRWVLLWATTFGALGFV